MIRDDDFLKKVYEEHQDKLRWHSEIEYKLLNMLIIINPVIITAVIGLNEYIDDKVTYFVLVLAMSSFLLILTVYVDKKVKHEHSTYEAVGQDVVRIWEYFGLFKSSLYHKPILTEEAKEYGKGFGYKKTLHIIWAMTITTFILLIGFGFTQLIPYIMKK